MGCLDLDFPVLAIPGRDSQQLITVTAEPDGTAAAAVRRLER